MEDRDKLYLALQTLKNGVEYAFDNAEVNETSFNDIKWVTGVDAGGSAVTTTTCPHSEITWTLVKAEMDKL